MFYNNSNSTYTLKNATASAAGKIAALLASNEIHLASTDNEAAINPLKTGSRYIRFLPKFQKLSVKIGGNEYPSHNAFDLIDDDNQWFIYQQQKDIQGFDLSYEDWLL